MRHTSPSTFTESQLARKEVLHSQYTNNELTRDVLCRSKRTFGEDLRQTVPQYCEGFSVSVSVFAGYIAFPEVMQPSLHDRKRQSEISESAPQVGVNCLAPLFLQSEKFDDKALLPLIHQFILTSC
jgi:hypothetical protein